MRGLPFRGESQNCVTVKRLFYSPTYEVGRTRSEATQSMTQEFSFKHKKEARRAIGFVAKLRYCAFQKILSNIE